jgi:hydroxymethylpyrimidine pyrophosphatase-like HAD family hydrolase
MQNDLAMFRASGLSIAMGNAPDEVKKLATHVTASNEDEGFARAIELILQRNEKDQAREQPSRGY